MVGEPLYELHELGAESPVGERVAFDLVVVDTPPTRNALYFLDAPRRLSHFLDHRLYRMLTAPTRAYLRAVNVATQALVRTVWNLVGGEVLEDALRFFKALEGMEPRFKERAAHVQALVSDPRLAYLLVASALPDPLSEPE